MGNKVREIRQKRGWQAQQLAEKAGISTATLSNIETGHIPETGVYKALRICKALNVSVATAFPLPDDKA
jgi:transcriptional regulator with XRE-family HTH domain